MVRAVYPGSFDPVTYGHLDIIKRSSALVDELVVGILENKAKKPLFDLEERFEMLREATLDMPKVRVVTFAGMTVDFAKEYKANFIIRGLRAVTDYENEMQIAQTNRMLCPEIETLFLTNSLEYAFCSSTIVKEVAAFHRDISKFVPEHVEKKLCEKYK